LVKAASYKDEQCKLIFKGKIPLGILFEESQEVMPLYGEEDFRFFQSNG
jgi:hypothetical protein